MVKLMDYFLMLRPIFFLLSWLAVGAAFAQPTDADYRLGPGGQIQLMVFSEPELRMEIRLSDSGRLNYPFLGEIRVEGLTVSELEQLITGGLKDSYLVDPIVTVSITEYRPFFLSGEVLKPGAIPYQPRLTVERAILLGGGITDFASLRKIYVIRGSDPAHEAVRVELSDPVYPGDIITVKQSFF